VNDVDWTKLAEEIEGRWPSELRALENFPRLIMTHLLKLSARPDSEACNHQRSEIVAFQAEAARRFSPSMRPPVDADGLYATALKQLQTIDRTLKPRPHNPFSRENLLNDDGDLLLTRLPAKA
jgi:Domain of unknown function DUF29